METFTLPQLVQILTLLQGVGFEHFFRAIEPGLLIQMKSNQRDVEEKAKNAEEQRVELATREHFGLMREIITKTVHPKNLIVTRPQVKCTYKSNKADRYQMRFWNGEYGHFNRGGDVSNHDNPFSFLCEYYSKKEQPHWLKYPNEVDELSRMYEEGRHPFGGDWVWRKETVTISCGDMIDVFTLHQVK